MYPMDEASLRLSFLDPFNSPLDVTCESLTSRNTRKDIIYLYIEGETKNSLQVSNNLSSGIGVPDTEK